MSQEIEIELESDTEGEEEIDEDVDVPAFDPAKIIIFPRQDALSNIIERIKNNEIDMDTEFQRHANIWDDVRMSRLIESILVRFPIQPFYFDASNDNKWLIVDGLQRLSSIKKFVIDEKLKLKGLEYLKDLEGKKYSELDRPNQRKINESPIHLFILQPGTPEDVKYSIFRRINTGGISLNNQEIRYALAKNEVRTFLKDLAKNEYLIKAVGGKNKRMQNQELALRFLSFYSMNYLDRGYGNISGFIDTMMQNLNKSNQSKLEEFGKIFCIAMKRSWDIFGENVFEKRATSSQTTRRIKNSSLFEAWSVALAKLSDDNFSKILDKKEDLAAKHSQMITNDQEYFDAITYATQKRDNFKIRHSKVDEIIKEILNA